MSRPGSLSIVPVTREVRRIIAGAVLILSLGFAPGALDAQVVVTGTVTRSGVGLSGADLDIVNPSGVSLSLSGDVTGVGGAFSVTILQGALHPVYTPGSYTLEINPLPGSLAITPTVNLTIPATGGSQSLGSFAVTPGYIISGTVVDSFGIGVTGLDIDIQPDSGGASDPIVTGDTTGPGGAFAVTMQQLPDDYIVQFVAPSPLPAPNTCTGAGQAPTANPNCASGVMPVQLAPQFIAGNTSLGIVTAKSAACLSARIISSTGNPIPSIDTQVTDNATGLSEFLNEDDSDCLGNIHVMVPLGNVDILFRDPVPEGGGAIDFAPVFFEGVNVTENLDLGDVVMSLGRTVTGTVQRQNGLAIAGAEIEFFDATTGALTPQSNDVTNGAGFFTYFVGDGSYLCEIDPPLALVTTVVPIRVPVTVSAGNTSLGTFTLLNGFQVSGHCVNNAGGNVGNVDVEFRISSSGVAVEALHENANATGNFAATIPPNTYDVLFHPPFGSGRAPAVQTVALNAVTNLGNIVLGAGVSLSGIVRSGTTPVTGAEVILAGAINYDNISGSNGAYGYQVAPGTYNITVTPPAGSSDSPLTLTGVTVTANTILDFDLAGGGPVPFIRGDANQSGSVNISDAIFMLAHLFQGQAASCFDAMDANDSGSKNISDVIYLLGTLFGGGPPPPPPFPTAGNDPTPDGLTCP